MRIGGWIDARLLLSDGRRLRRGRPSWWPRRSGLPGAEAVHHEQLSTDAVPERRRGGIRSSIIITVDRSEDVDELTERARAAGARITKDPVAAEFFEGRDAYFADPEGNYWEVAWSAGDNPVTAAARRAAGQ